MNEQDSADPTLGFAVPDWTPPLHPPREIMQGRLCRIEPIDPRRHAETLFDANRYDDQSRNWTYLPYGPFANLADYVAWMEQNCCGDDPLFHAIIDLRTERACGVASYLGINPAWGSIEVGHINYAPELQNRPAATEAMYLMMRRAFELGYRRYEWKCNALNQKSRNAALRLGFTFEGVFRQHMVAKGRNRDSAWFSLLDGEWPATRAIFETWLDPANFDANARQRQSLSQMMAARK